MKVVVTGGAGFIGANLVHHLLRTGSVEEVTVADDFSTGSEQNLKGAEGAHAIDASILDEDALSDAVRDADAVVHLAAQPSVPMSLEDPKGTHEINSTGTLAVLEAARRAGGLHVVAASSSAVYGSSPVLPKTESMAPVCLSPYASSKLGLEAHLCAYSEGFGLPVLPFRFFNVFGPLQPPGHAYAAVVPAFVDAALSGRPLTIYGDGLQTRDFVSVGSVVDLLTQAILRRVTSSTPVNLAFGSRRTLLDLVAELEGVLGRDLEVRHEATRPGDVRHSQADDSRLRELFPDSKPVPFAQGLAETVDWFRAYR